MPNGPFKFAPVGAALLALLLAGGGAAQQLPAPPPAAPGFRFAVRPWPHGAVLAATAAAAALPVVFERDLARATCAPCDPAALPGLDRGAVGLPDTGLSRLSTAALAATVGSAAALVALTRRGEPEALRAALEDVVVVAQAVAAAAAAANWLKIAAARPRPVRYSSAGAAATDPDDGLSFPSGHAAVAFAAAAAAASVLQQRGELGRLRWAVASLGVLAAATGAARIGAHRHFPTDVAAGAVLGVAAGWFVPRLMPGR